MMSNYIFILISVLLISCESPTSEQEPEYRTVMKTEDVLFFSSDIGEGKAKNIYMANLNGEIVKQVTHEIYGEYAAVAISPDSTRLLFYKAALGYDIDLAVEIFIYDILQDSIIGPVANGDPKNFFPDGEKFVFVRHFVGLSSLYIYDLKTNTERRLTFEDKYVTDGRVSPNGELIVYQTVTMGNVPSRLNRQLHLMDTTGAHLKNLTPMNSGYTGNPIFNLAGTEVIFDYNERGSVYDICKVNITSNKLINLTKYRPYSPNFYNASLLPSNNKIYFNSKTYDDSLNLVTDLWSVDLNGKNLNRITNDQTWQSHPIAIKVSYYIQEEVQN